MWYDVELCKKGNLSVLVEERGDVGMRNLVAWCALLCVFLIAGEGINLFRNHIGEWLAYGHLNDAVWTLGGLVIAFFATAFLGGYVYHRDKKRGKLKREGWRGRPVKPQPKKGRPKS